MYVRREQAGREQHGALAVHGQVCAEDVVHDDEAHLRNAGWRWDHDQVDRDGFKV